MIVTTKLMEKVNCRWKQQDKILESVETVESLWEYLVLFGLAVKHLYELHYLLRYFLFFFLL